MGKISLIQALRNAAKTVPLCKHAADHIIELKAQIKAVKGCTRLSPYIDVTGVEMEPEESGDYFHREDVIAALQQENDDESDGS